MFIDFVAQENVLGCKSMAWGRCLVKKYEIVNP
jgi:hypothetical protein